MQRGNEMSKVIHLDFTKGTIEQDLVELPEKMLNGAFEAVDQAADMIVGLAQINVRVDKGTLRDSIHKEYFKGERSFMVRVVAGGPNIRYARIIEEKWPYLGPAVRSVLPQVRTMIENKVMEKVR